MKLHVHPISAHFPNALFPISAGMIILYIIFNFECFEKTAYYCLIFGFLGSPVGMLSGINDWKKRYKGAKVPLFLEKRRLSIILTILSFILIIIRTLIPDIATSGGIKQWIYIVLIFSLTPIAGRLGYLGGKLVFK